MTPREVANLLDCTTQYVYKLCKEERLEAHRPWPRHVLITRSSVERWQSGERPTFETLTAAKAHVKANGGNVEDMPREALEDLLYEFIVEIRPDWFRADRGIWIRETADALQA